MGKEDRIILTNYTLAQVSPWYANHVASRKSMALRIGIPGSRINTNVGATLFSVEETLKLDEKVDDGRARSGWVSGHNAYLSGPGGQSSEGCLEFGGAISTNDPNIGNYNINTEFKCNISFDF